MADPHRLSQLAVLVCLLAAAAPAQDNGAPKSIEAGFEQRTRSENWNNIIDYNEAMDDQRNQTRWRTRAWLKAPFTSSIDFYVGLAQETNQIVIPRRAYRILNQSLDVPGRGGLCAGQAPRLPFHLLPRMKGKLILGR